MNGAEISRVAAFWATPSLVIDDERTQNSTKLTTRWNEEAFFIGNIPVELEKKNVIQNVYLN